MRSEAKLKRAGPGCALADRRQTPLAEDTSPGAGQWPSHEILKKGVEKPEFCEPGKYLVYDFLS
jgi:hypothetical protein